MIKLVNLTPHTINIRGAVSMDVAPSGTVARCSQNNVIVGDINGIPVSRQVFGTVVDLPAPQEGVVYIVSRMVADACRDREDLVIPGPLLRNEAGQPIGCDGLSVL